MQRIISLCCACMAVFVLEINAVVAKDKGASSVNPARVDSNQVDLMSLYQESRLEDPRILSAYAKEKSSDNREREAFGKLLPQVSANMSLNRVTREIQGSMPVNTTLSRRSSYNTQRYAVSITQYLYNKEIWEGYQKFKSLAVQKDYETEGTLAEATIDLASRYFIALAADDDLDLVIAERRATQKNLDRVNALYKRQMAMVTDVLELQARVDTLTAQELEARNEVQLAREGLAELVGRPVTERLSRVREDIALSVPGGSLDTWVERAVRDNPSLKAKESAVEASSAAIREGQAGHHPTVSLNLSAQKSNFGTENAQGTKADSYVTGVTVQLPIFSGGATSARVRALHNDRAVAEQDLEAMRRQVVKETTKAYLTAQTTIEKIKALKRAMESSEHSSIAAQKGFQFGVVNAVDVLDSVKKEYQSRRDLLKAQYDFITNLLVLNRWVGELSEKTVEGVNHWLSASAQSAALKPDPMP